MGYGPETVESTRFTDATDFVLDLVRETRIEVMMQSAITVSLNLGHNSIEVDHIAVGNNKGMGNPHGLRVWVSLGSGSGWSNKLPTCKPEPIHIPMGTLCRVAHFTDHDSSCHLMMSVIHASIRLEL